MGGSPMTDTPGGCGPVWRASGWACAAWSTAGAARRPARPGAASEALDLVAGERVEDVLRERLGKLLLPELDLGVGPTAMVERDDSAVVVGVAVGAYAEHLSQRAGQPDQEA